MKKILVILLSAAVLSSFAQDKKKTVKADGPVVKKERSIGSFDGVSTSSAIDVYLTQGSGNSLSIETEENLHDYIKAEVKDNVLHLYTDANIKETKGMKAYVGIDNVTLLEASSAGDIHSEGRINADEIKLSASSAGDINLHLDAKSVHASTNSAGDIKLAGKADFLKASANSSGDIKASDFEVKEAKVSASSAGDVLVNVKEKLDASASSMGDVRYVGNPDVNADSGSGGSVKKK